MRTKLSVLLAGFGVLMIAAVPVLAHHAFGAEFDPNRPVLLNGKVTRVEWVNPHAWIHIAMVQSDGTTEEWMVEGGTPSTLLRHGITRDSLQVGTEIVVDGYQSKDRSRTSNGRDVIRPDGRNL